MKSYIGCSLNNEERYRATSGGVGSALLRYLFSENVVTTAISFKYNVDKLMFEPYLIYDIKDYEITSSIYHEIDLLSFLKEKISEIRGTFACFCLPCQVRSIKGFLEKMGHECIIIGLICSSQLSIDATYFLLKRLKINRGDVKYIQYRGNGWPSGVQIYKSDGSKLIIPNNKSLWTDIFHSRLFIKKKCFLCQNTLNCYSDISLADPWLKEFTDTETIGNSLIVANSKRGEEILNLASKKDYIRIIHIDSSKVIESQSLTIKKKEKFKRKTFMNDLYIRICTSSLYRKLALSNNLIFKAHVFIKNKLEYHFYIK